MSYGMLRRAVPELMLFPKDWRVLASLPGATIRLSYDMLMRKEPIYCIVRVTPLFKFPLRP
jgi:hypothetical protein